MKAFAALMIVSVGACSRDVEVFPIGPGGGGPPGGIGTPDAAVDGALGDGAQLIGRVCLVNDAREPTQCAATGAGGLTVTLGGQTVITADSGAFSMMRPGTATNLVWRVSGTNIVPSALQFTGDANIIPVIDVQLYEVMLAPIAVVVGGNGAVIARATHAGIAVSNVVADPLPQQDSVTYYDGANIDEWNTDHTGPFGVLWVPSIAAGTASLTLTSPEGMITVPGIPVFAGTITFVFAEIP